MKEIKAIIKPNMLDYVLEALMEIPDLPGVTVSRTEGFGRQRGMTTGPDPGEYATVEKVKIEIVVPDRLVEVVVGAIQRSAHTGRPGDGKIFIAEVLKSIRIRTGQVDDDAL